LSSGRQSEKVPVFLDWDQTHTFNTTVSAGESGNWNATLVGKFGTGLPYTPQITGQQVFLRTNSSRKPSQLSFDLLAEKYFNLSNYRITVFLKVFNLFDTLNERLVYTDTGTASYSLTQNQGAAQETDKLAQTIDGVHPASEYFQRPNYYLPPREIRLGVSFQF